MDPDVYAKMRGLESTHWWFTGRRAYIDQLIKRLVKLQDGRTFCEVGAGTGGNLWLLGAHAPTDAVEYEEDAVAMIRARALPSVRRVEQGSLPDKIPFDDLYDAVFSLDVVEHVEDDSAAVERLASMLKPGGKLVLTVPSYMWLWSGHDVANRHFRRYHRKQFNDLVRSAGLTVEFSSYFNTLLFPLRLLQHLKAKILPPTKDKWEVEMPPAPVNRLFAFVFSQERHLAGRLPLPFGLSIAVIARKPEIGNA